MTNELPRKVTAGRAVIKNTKSTKRLLKPISSQEKASQEKWDEFDALDDKQIEQAVANDPDAALVGDNSFWDNAKVIMPISKHPISIRIDADVLAYFKDMGPGYQSRMNAVLRSFMEAKD